jgi:hypothetical protein
MLLRYHVPNLVPLSVLHLSFLREMKLCEGANKLDCKV